MERHSRDQVFISYSHRDKRWLKRLQKMLKPLVRSGTISLWADTAIASGAQWRQELEAALASTRVAVLLVSDEFLASDFIAEHELPHLLEAAEVEGVRILWVYLRACHYEATPIGSYQAAHDIDRPLAELSRPKQDRVLLEISKRIQEAFAEELPALGIRQAAPVERLAEREEPLILPQREDGIVEVLTLHLGETTIVGRCYAGQLREAARQTLSALDETRIHWVLAWDDERLNQLIARLAYRPAAEGDRLEILNLTGYSSRRQSFAVTGETSSEHFVGPEEAVELPLKPRAALTVTSGVGSGRQQLFRLFLNRDSGSHSGGEASIPVIQTADTAFLFPPTGGPEALVVRFLGCWIPLGSDELAHRLSRRSEPLRIRFPRREIDLVIALSPMGTMLAWSEALSLSQLLDAEA